MVADEGAGVPGEFIPQLFERFARADKKKSKASAGTGLGLSIVRGLAEAGRGRAWFEPNRPTGARFGVSFPLSGAVASLGALAPDGKSA